MEDECEPFTVFPDRIAAFREDIDAFLEKWNSSTSHDFSTFRTIFQQMHMAAMLHSNPVENREDFVALLVDAVLSKIDISDSNEKDKDTSNLGLIYLIYTFYFVPPPEMRMAFAVSLETFEKLFKVRHLAPRALAKLVENQAFLIGTRPRPTTVFFDAGNFQYAGTSIPSTCAPSAHVVC